MKEFKFKIGSLVECGVYARQCPSLGLIIEQYEDICNNKCYKVFWMKNEFPHKKHKITNYCEENLKPHEVKTK